MKENYTHISVVLDRSGSMSTMAKEVIGGFNKLLEDQLKVNGTATMTLVRFDNVYEVIDDFVTLSDVTKLDTENFVPRGWTALLDAMGKTMESVRSRIDSMSEDEKPSKAIFVFITDGGENSSNEYNKARVFEMISDLQGQTNQSETKWEFVFIGANQDAISEGGNLGIRANASLTYSASGDGATMAFRSLSKGLSNYRTSVGEAYSFSGEDRQAQEKIDSSTKTNRDLDKFAKAIPSYLTDL